MAKEQADIFDIVDYENDCGNQSHEAKLSKKRLHTLRDMVIYKGSPLLNEESFKKAYDKYKGYLKTKFTILLHESNEDLSGIAMASAYNYFLKRDYFIKSREDKFDTRDLTNFLATNLNRVFDHKDKMVEQNKVGMVFLNSFVKTFITSTEVDGREGKNLNRTAGNWKQMYRSALKTMYLGEDMTAQNVFSTIRFSDGSQIPSNFRPLASAFIFNKYGLKANPNEKDIYLHCSSEGFLGRTLSTFYLAYNNPDKNIHYYTIDPNLQVVNAFYKLVNWLRENIAEVPNWFPIIHNIGSEVEEAHFYKRYGKVFHCSFTSPPYFDLEKYPETYILYKAIDFENKGLVRDFKVNDKIKQLKYIQAVKLFKEDISAEILYKGDEGKYEPFITVEKFSENDLIQTSTREKKIKELKLGDVLGKRRLVVLDKIGQSHQYTTFGSWNENFLRPTVKNISDSMNIKGHLILNVINIKSHTTLEEDTVSIAEDNNYRLVDTLKLKLSRVPGIVLLPDGTTKLLREYKQNWEPIFVFKKH